jgi:hypothetical protein
MRLENGDQVMISVAQSGVKVVKMKWAGMLPAATLWESRTVAEVAERFFNTNEPAERPLDAMIEKLINCRSAADVVARLAAPQPSLASRIQSSPKP